MARWLRLVWATVAVVVAGGLAPGCKTPESGSQVRTTPGPGNVDAYIDVSSADTLGSGATGKFFYAKEDGKLYFNCINGELWAVDLSAATEADTAVASAAATTKRGTLFFIRYEASGAPGAGHLPGTNLVIGKLSEARSYRGSPRGNNKMYKHYVAHARDDGYNAAEEDDRLTAMERKLIDLPANFQCTWERSASCMHLSLYVTDVPGAPNNPPFLETSNLCTARLGLTGQEVAAENGRDVNALTYTVSSANGDKHTATGYYDRWTEDHMHEYGAARVEAMIRTLGGDKRVFRSHIAEPSMSLGSLIGDFTFKGCVPPL